MGVVIKTSKCPRINVRTLLHGKRDEPLVRSLNLGLLFKDPPSQRSDEILAENDARKRASEEVEEAWHDKLANMILMYRQYSSKYIKISYYYLEQVSKFQVNKVLFLELSHSLYSNILKAKWEKIGFNW